MTFEEYDSFVDHVVDGYAQQQVDSGLVPAAEAASYAREQHDQVLPDGIATPNHHLWTVRDASGRQVGLLWLHVRPRPGGLVEAFVYDVELMPEARGQGLGRATMLAAEDAARELGADLLRLNVFGHNRPAIRLYSGLGYDVAMSSLTLRLDDAPLDPGAGTVRLEDVAAGETDAALRRLEDHLADGLACSLLMSDREARDEARAAMARLLADGPATPGALLLAARDGDTDLGEVWVHVAHRSDGPHAQARLLVDPARLAEVLAAVTRTCGARGVTSLDVTVHGFEPEARSLYESAGFTLTAMQMLKPLTD